MSVALAGHDALARAAVERHHGTVVKTTGDGMHAAFGDPVDALRATIDLQQSIADPASTGGLGLRIRCGLHAGVVERRDNDYFGRAVNRAARIMTAAHGGQVLLSQAVATLVSERLPDRSGAARSGGRALARSRRSRARLPGVASEASRGFSGAADARSDAEQPAAADHFVHRARARARRSARAARQNAAADTDRCGGPGQDAAVAAARSRYDGRLSGRCLVRRARPARRRGSGAASRGDGPRRQGRSGKTGDRGDRQGGPRSRAARDPRQLRASRRRLRRTRSRGCCAPLRRSRCSLRAESSSALRERRSFRFPRLPFPRETGTSRPQR